jgi:hypothetical protein
MQQGICTVRAAAAWPRDANRSRKGGTVTTAAHDLDLDFDLEPLRQAELEAHYRECGSDRAEE